MTKTYARALSAVGIRKDIDRDAFVLEHAVSGPSASVLVAAGDSF
jgi:hypothetical protein